MYIYICRHIHRASIFRVRISYKRKGYKRFIGDRIFEGRGVKEKKGDFPDFARAYYDIG